MRYKDWKEIETIGDWTIIYSGEAARSEKDIDDLIVLRNPDVFIAICNKHRHSLCNKCWLDKKEELTKKVKFFNKMNKYGKT